MPPQKEHGQHILRQTFNPIARTLLVAQELNKTRQGSLIQRKQQIVCTACNSGWMGRIVEDAKGSVVSMMSSEAVTFTSGHATAVSAWVTLCCIIAEFTDRSTIGIDNGDRSYLMRCGVPPSNWRIFTGRYEGEAWAPSRYRHHGEKFIVREPSGEVRVGLSQISTHVIGSLAVHAFSSTELAPQRFFDQFCSPVGMVRIWPNPAAIAWPSQPLLGDTDLTLIADRYTSETLSRGMILQDR